VDTGRKQWTDAEFLANGEEAVRQDIRTDMINVCQGKDPKDMKVIEIGCGAGRLTQALSNLFGEVHAVDVSGEMIETARRWLGGRPNIHFYRNNGSDLSVIPAGEYDFAYSGWVFQHIPSREIIDNYVREVHRLLRPGALFKFQVQGYVSPDSSPDDTWHGVSYSEQQAREMAERCGFEMRYSYGAGQQYFWLWYFKHPAPEL
jgi:ubiquinone/menaquinone biosynthesis C-methylase UbiE